MDTGIEQCLSLSFSSAVLCVSLRSAAFEIPFNAESRKDTQRTLRKLLNKDITEDCTA